MHLSLATNPLSRVSHWALRIALGTDQEAAYRNAFSRMSLISYAPLPQAATPVWRTRPREAMALDASIADTSGQDAAQLEALRDDLRRRLTESYDNRMLSTASLAVREVSASSVVSHSR